MVKSDEPCGRVLAIFISNKKTIPVIDLIFEQSVIRFASMNVTFQHANSELRDDSNKENFENLESEIPEAIDKDSIEQWIKTLYVTCKNGKFACPCSFNFIRDHDCQDIVAVRLFIKESKIESLYNNLSFLCKSAAELSTTSSLKSYLCQRDANGHTENELRLLQKKDPKNNRKTRLIPQESIQLQDTPFLLLKLNQLRKQIIFELMKQKQWIEAKILWIANLPPYGKLIKEEQLDLFEGLSEQFFEQFFHDSLDQNLLVVKITIMTMCSSDYCPKKVLFPVNCFDITLMYFYRCTGDTVSKRQIDQRLPLIFVINGTEISTINEKTSLQNKDLLEEINFPKGNQITKQRYRLMGVSFCNGIHHIADVCFENIKNSGWYQYDGLQKTYKARAMTIGSSRPPPKSVYTIDFVIYEKI
ncbi:hypothetical protein G9A89_014268 [Geosiphon pyriformis]|nr:hypothetical protein G9A89_014268 [Geosiphon pyriformis]